MDVHSLNMELVEGSEVLICDIILLMYLIIIYM